MTIVVQETRDVPLLRRLLEGDRIGGAYLLGDLEPPFFDKGRWLLATREGGRPTAVVLVFDAFADPVVLSFGETRAVEAIVAALDRPRSEVLGLRLGGEACYLKAPPEHEPVLAAAFDVLERDIMTIMALDRGAFCSAIAGHDVRRLDATFPIDQVLDVYTSYPGHFFEPGQLNHGIYYGSFDGSRLVAVAGTHVYSPVGRVACLGNIVTATEARGRGHGAACTSAVVEELYGRGCETIALHVAATNAPAQACYRRIGFVAHGPILQLRAKHARAVAGHEA